MIKQLKAQFPEGVIESAEQGNQLLLTVEAGVLLKVAQYIYDAGYSYPTDITAVDTGQELRVIYRVYSIPQNRYVVISVLTARKGGRVPSVAQIWRGAEAFEREIFDLFGITFDKHPDLRRILLPPDWEDIPPLLKDYKLPTS